MDMSNLGRWTVRSLRVAALTAGLAWGASAAFAQYPSAPASSQAGMPGGQAAGKKTFTKNTTFNLPIQMEERVRATLREVQLYVKSGSSDWVRQDVVAPQTPHFTYRVPSDGEYWFALITVDKSGKASSDIATVTPALRVVVDTKAPMMETAIVMEGGEPVLRVNVIDANPDMNSVRAVVLTEQGDRALAPIQGGSPGFRLTANDLNSPIRVTAADLSGNMTTKDVIGRDLLSSPGMVRNDSPQQLPANLNPGMLPAMGNPQLGGSPPPAYQPPQGNINTTAFKTDGGLGDRPTNRKIINTTHASIDYRIDTVGPSGIGRVDIYLTPDKGQSWTKIAEDQDKRSPAEIDLPGEGLFGIRLAITNGNGFGGKAPKQGDRPSFFIEVDATSPFVQLQPIDMVPASGAVDIRWTAKDNNMAPEPVTIYYRTRTDGTWQPVARNVKNDGVYRWVFPREISQFFLKLEVADLAGNVTKVETPMPILLDTTEPEATLVDVNGIPSPGAGSPMGAPPLSGAPLSGPSMAPSLLPGRN